jgi:hypothetical protein
MQVHDVYAVLQYPFLYNLFILLIQRLLCRDLPRRSPSLPLDYRKPLRTYQYWLSRRMVVIDVSLSSGGHP